MIIPSQISAHSLMLVVDPHEMGPSTRVLNLESRGSSFHIENLCLEHSPCMIDIRIHLSIRSGGGGKNEEDCSKVSITDRTISFADLLTPFLRERQLGRKLPIPYVTRSFRVPIRFLAPWESLWLTGDAIFLII